MAFDPTDYCSNPKCGGTADACGCPSDHNTQSRMRCPHCSGSWWRAYGDPSTRCPHPGCGRDGSQVERPAAYAPTRDENGQDLPEPTANPDDDCAAEFIDGTWTNCGCDDCRQRAADEDEALVETGGL